MCNCDTELPKFFDQKTVKAKKNHRCCECGDEIAPGDSYVRSSGKWDGEVKTYSTCQKCDRVSRLARMLHPDFCRLFGGLFEEMRACDLYWEDEEGSDIEFPDLFYLDARGHGCKVPRLTIEGAIVLDIKEAILSKKLQESREFQSWQYRGKRVDLMVASSFDED